MDTQYLENWDTKAEQQKADFMEFFELCSNSASGIKWRKKTSKYSNKKVGSPAGTLYKSQKTENYKCWVVQLKKKRYQVSHVVWYLHGNLIPIGYEIDHKNGDATDNRIENLRLATRSEQCMNRKNPNVCWSNAHKKWIARITKKRKTKFLGYFSTKEEAVLTYNIAAKKIHGEFAR